MQTFAELLRHYMDDAKPKISANKMEKEIGGITRQAILNWKNGKSMPDKNHRDKVLACAHFLGLTERQTNEYLLAAGFTKEYVDFPEAIFTEFIRDLFAKIRQIRPYPVILLLTQANWDEPPYREALLTQAKKYYSPNNVLHIHLYSSSNNLDDYFSEFGEQCGFNEVNEVSHFEQALRGRLKQTEQLFFLVSRFEQGSQSVRENLARLLRSMSETYANRFHVILCGGEKLADMKYQNGDMSLLNHAKVEHWPELGFPEIYALRDYRFKELQLHNVIDQFLTISGAHPQLLNDCLELRKEKPELSLDDYPKELSQRDYVWQLFTQLQHNLDTSAKQQILEWLQREDVSDAQPYILHPLLRQLYWKNLLVEREFNGKQRLCWRCEALRIAGKNILNSS